MNLAYTVSTRVDASRIITDISDSFDGIHSRILRQVMDTQEEQVREALIQLGWTPPAKPQESGNAAANGLVGRE